MPEKISLKEKLSKFNKVWSPRLLFPLNDCNVMLVKCKGELPWHSHEREDEMFLTLKGTFIVRFEEGEVFLRKGECIQVPSGMRHQTAARKLTEILYVSRKNSSNTGQVTEKRTVRRPKRV